MGSAYLRGRGGGHLINWLAEEIISSPSLLYHVTSNVHFLFHTVEEEANSVKLQEEMMYQSSEHAVSIETLKADYENVLEETSSELKRKHQGEITLGSIGSCY